MFITKLCASGMKFPENFSDTFKNFLSFKETYVSIASIFFIFRHYLDTCYITIF